MPKFGVHSAGFSVTTAVKTAIMFWALSNRRAEIIELLATGGGTAAVADTPIQASAAFASTTLVGVGTTRTAEKLDGQGAATIGTCTTVDFSTEPTTYASVFPVFFGFNTRGGNKFSVPQGEGLKVDSGASNNRLGWRLQGQAAATCDSQGQGWED
jgi:hypothetical protein